MKTYKGISLFFSLLLLIVVSSCKKDDVKSSYNYKNTIYPSKTETPVFASGDKDYVNPGENNIVYPNGNDGSGTEYPDLSNSECLVGNWIIPVNTCWQGFHLQLAFAGNGNGNAKHLDEYLCCVNMNLDFTWCLANDGILHIVFSDGSVSNLLFSCPAEELRIMWMNTNLKILVRG